MRVHRFWHNLSPRRVKLRRKLAAARDSADFTVWFIRIGGKNGDDH